MIRFYQKTNTVGVQVGQPLETFYIFCLLAICCIYICSLNHVLYQEIIDPTGTETWQNFSRMFVTPKKIKSDLLLFVIV